MDLCIALNGLFTTYDHVCSVSHVEKIKSIGSCYLAVSGAPDAREDHAESAVSVAFNMLRIADILLKSWPQLSVKIGIHSGPLVGGVLGTRKFAYDIFGDTVNTASRLMSSAAPRALQVSTATYAHLPYSIIERYDWQDTQLTLKGKGIVAAHVLHNLTRRTKIERHSFRKASVVMSDGEVRSPPVSPLRPPVVLAPCEECPVRKESFPEVVFQGKTLNVSPRASTTQ